MEPRIQYAQTKDGVSIAYYTLGDGMPIVTTPSMGWSHAQMELRDPGRRSWYEKLAQKRRVVRYDTRGSGLSERDVRDFSLDQLLLDMEAVVDRLALDKFALFGPAFTGPVAIAYASRHPERVSHLVLWCTWARTPEIPAPLKKLTPLMDEDWELYSETLLHVAIGWDAGEIAHRAAGMLRESVSEEAYRSLLTVLTNLDVSGLLSAVQCPTLVFHRRGLELPVVDVARGLASRIHDARLALLEGEKSPPWMGDMEAALAAIDEFLGEGEESAGAPEAGSFRTVLFTDVEGSTALTGRLGDAKARELLREHERMVREALKAHGGSEVKTMGDGFMTSFSSATRALKCAIAMQRAFAEWNAGRGGSRTAPAPEPIRIRIGLNAGEPIAEDEDLYGTAVNLAARITAQGKGGEILVSEAVRQIVAGKKFPFSDLGETALRGFEDRVHIYQVSWREA